MSNRITRHGRLRRLKAKLIRRELRRSVRSLQEWFEANTGPQRFAHVRPDGTIVVTETATAPDCRMNARMVTLEPR